MSRRNLGSSESHMFLPCGKEIIKSERDADKYMKTHKKVCALCRECVEVKETQMALTDGLQITKNGGITRIAKFADSAENKTKGMLEK
jgi:hypothetical protein